MYLTVGVENYRRVRTRRVSLSILKALTLHRLSLTLTQVIRESTSDCHTNNSLPTRKKGITKRKLLKTESLRGETGKRGTAPTTIF